ncbi:hypothetical protein B0H13DRAFT_1589783, partial [Mycena leptocephala]
LGSDHDHTVFESEIVGATLALSSIRSLPHLRRIFLGIDSQNIIRALSHPKQQPEQYLLLEFHAELARLHSRAPNIRLRLDWSRVTLNLNSKERVDKEAKEAAAHDESPNIRLFITR